MNKRDELKLYKLEKVRLLRRDFCIPISLDEYDRIMEAKDELHVDRVARDIWMDALSYAV